MEDSPNVCKRSFHACVLDFLKHVFVTHKNEIVLLYEIHPLKPPLPSP